MIEETEPDCPKNNTAKSPSCVLPVTSLSKTSAPTVKVSPELMLDILNIKLGLTVYPVETKTLSYLFKVSPVLKKPLGAAVL